jgi:thymidylate synthase
MSTRRAVAITWTPEVDQDEKNVPCLQLIMCTIRRGRLDMKVVFRSNDMLSALGANMYGLTELQKFIADKIGVPVGTYTHISLVPHVYYKRDASELSKMLGPDIMYGAAGEMAIDGMRV